MPSLLYSEFHKLLVNLLNGSQVMPPMLSLGLRNTAPSEQDTLIAGTEVDGYYYGGKSTGYAPKSFPSSEMSYSGGVLTLPTQTWTFSLSGYLGPNPPKLTATHWFLFDPASGREYASGPLGTNNVTTSLAVDSTLVPGPGGNSYNTLITIPTADAAGLGLGDFLNLGTACAGNAGFGVIQSFGTPVTLNHTSYTPITLNGALGYPAGTPVKQDAARRVYGDGSVETVSATISLQ